MANETVWALNVFHGNSRFKSPRWCGSPTHNPQFIPASVADIPLPVCMNYYSTCLRHVGLCRPCLLVIGLGHSVLSSSEFIRVVELDNSSTVRNKSQVFKTESRVTVCVCTGSIRSSADGRLHCIHGKACQDHMYESINISETVFTVLSDSYLGAKLIIEF